MSMSIPRVSFTFFTASLMIESVFRPRKSIFYKTCLLNDTSLVLRYKKLTFLFIRSRRNRNPVGYIVAADYNTAGMNTCVSHIALKLARIL